MNELFIYAIRDRMLDYFQTPFVASSDKQVLASLTTVINSNEATNAIAQAPHHFELYRLGAVTEEGSIRQDREFIADCSSLVRSSVRNGTAPGGPEVPRPALGRPDQIGGPAAEGPSNGSRPQQG